MDQFSDQGGDQDVHAAASATASSRGTKTKAAFRRVLSILPAIGAALFSGVCDIGTERNVETRFFGDSFGFQDAPEDYGGPYGEIRSHWLGRGAPPVRGQRGTRSA